MLWNHLYDPSAPRPHRAASARRAYRRAVAWRVRLLLPCIAMLMLGVERCPALEGDFDPVVPVPPNQPYGDREMRVPAASYWVSTGLYLSAGESAQISATGEWNVEGGEGMPLYGPGGHPTRWGWGNRCKLGQLTARIGFAIDGPYHCIGASATLTAPAAVSGIVFLAAYGAAGDIPEWQDYRRNAVGELTARVISTGKTVPTILAADAPTYAYVDVHSGWLEIRGRRVILTVPAALAQQDAAQIPTAVERLDRIYEVEADLRGAMPYHGQRIRFFPQQFPPDWVGVAMLAGNPIRMAPDYVNPTRANRVTVAGDTWGFAHELGHTFTIVGGTKKYMDTQTLESWNNIFTMYAHETLGIGIGPGLGCNPQRRAAFINNPSSQYLEFRNDVWLQLCLFMDLRDVYGWEIHSSFFGSLNHTQDADIPNPAPCRIDNPSLCTTDADFRRRDAPIWIWVRNRWNAAAGDIQTGPADVTPILQRYKIPLGL